MKKNGKGSAKKAVVKSASKSKSPKQRSLSSSDEEQRGKFVDKQTVAEQKKKSAKNKKLREDAEREAAARMMKSLDSDRSRSSSDERTQKQRKRSPKLSPKQSPKGSKTEKAVAKHHSAAVLEHKFNTQPPKPKTENESDSQSVSGMTRDQALIAYQMAQIRRRKKKDQKAVVPVKKPEDSESDSDQTVRMTMYRTFTDLEQPQQIWRIYEARYKIPPQADLGELMSGKSLIYKGDDGSKLAKFREE